MTKMLNIVEVKMTVLKDKVLNYDILQHLNFENMSEAKSRISEIITRKSDIANVTKRHAEEMKNAEDEYVISIFFRERQPKTTGDIAEDVKNRNENWKNEINMIVDSYSKAISLIYK